MAIKKLTRSNNKMLAGVCAGLAEYFDIDVAMMRVIYAALTIFSTCFPGVLLYIVMALIIPQKSAASASSTANDGVEEADAEVISDTKKKKN